MKRYVLHGGTLLVMAACLAGVYALIGPWRSTADAASYLGPTAVVASRDGRTLFVAEQDARQVAVVGLPGGTVTHSVAVPAEPTALVLSPDGKTLYVTCAAPQSTVCVIEAKSGKVKASIPVGHTATGAAITPDGRRLYVCNRFDHDVSVIDLETNRETARVPAVREPGGAVCTPDGKSVFVINLLPLEPADGDDVAAVVTVIDTMAGRPANSIRLPNGSSSVRGLCISPDGKYVYVVHILARYRMPTTQLERGWMNTNALSIIDAAARKLVNTVLLDDVDMGAANPWGVTTTADGNLICISHAGAHELSVIDARALQEKLLKTPDREPADQAKGSDWYEPGIWGARTRTEVPSDLSFLVGLRRRIRLLGNGPHGVAVIGMKAYVAEYFTDTLGVVELAPGRIKVVAQVGLGPKPQLTVQRRGQMFFNDAGLCFQRWQSCASCHPDARVDGLNWDLMNDGIGNPKNVRSMLLAHKTPPSMSLGVRQSAEEAVRAGITYIQFAVRPEEDALAIDEYLKSLRPVPSPHLVGGRLSPAAERGKNIFFDPAVGCAKCHPEPLYTDLLMHDEYPQEGTVFDTPTLVECWRTAPYLHDGRWLSIRDLIGKGKHGKKSGAIEKLTPGEIDDLVEFVLSL